jgi:hypothetical protein
VPRRERDLEAVRATPGGTALASAARLLRPVLGEAALHRAFGTGPAACLGDVDSAALLAPPAKTSGDIDDDLARCVQELPR